ncbi:hypothetical protein AVME950_02175 [Acidovorax sp. SUPP950]|uniref:hypothetical protein n=1 Tax=Acidovorax sp. SUPP950 TaxID=511901 RepID=UPI0023CC87C7|nr:hypothetical protein [Acidovorax sp. SUPP950]GKS73653.1 hypothetical protein AVME950_02175 [Acidovorax sp. SUPP950]
MSDLVVVEETQILAEQADSSILAEEFKTTEILAVAEQGPPGPRGLPGPEGGATLVTVGAVPLSGHSAVACNSAGLLVPADSTNPSHRGAVLGLVADAYSPGDEAVVQTAYVLEHAGWTWAPGPVFVGTAGQPTQTLPIGALFSQALGQALSATRVLVDVQPPITIA